MKSTAIVFEHQFDPELLEQIESLRSVRLDLAEKMLANLQSTIVDLKARGLSEGQVPDIDERELRKELEDKIDLLRTRMGNPDVVYADEISFYVDLIENDANFQDVEIY